MRLRQRQRFSSLLLGAGLLSLGALAGCHSAFVQATVTNRTSRPIQLFEVDYPSASFGSGQLAPGAQFHYRFKVLGDGPAKLSWTDSLEHEYKSAGPALSEGMEGALTIDISETTASWTSQLQRHP